MRKLVLSIFLSGSLLATAGCADGIGTKQGVGTLGGAAAGGLAGSQFGKGKGQLAMTAGGVLLGALLGGEVGKSLDRADQAYATQAANRAYDAPVGETIRWENPESGNYGTVTPIRDGRNTQTGQYCREFTQTIYVGGRAEQATGRACQQQDGTWQIVP
ncbi:glycine zipper 2TM domain-containing protein [Skermanella mucosa]|uniref:RT0821/Lpp0805 family surface protein n=1 Tax=Skermanella mucosa TaxID=1789672 RepID=UPI00192C99DC|nr:RT0821/Lpp0805 family surface protein [Skermanella mucosa]UEM23883.1 glycine zipper 2TM domain-containing protein [Skermanella mucosa]